MTELAIKIINLRSLGKTYHEICSALHCSKGTVCYYLGENQKYKYATRRRQSRKNAHPFVAKLQNFLSNSCFRRKRYTPSKHKWEKSIYYKLHHFHNPNRKSSNRKASAMQTTSPTFTIKDLIHKFSSNPTCYLTGLPIDITKTSTYSFDHIIPSTRGGDNSIDNLGICTKQANMAKTDMTLDEFINLCKLVLQNNGYLVQKCGQ